MLTFVLALAIFAMLAYLLTRDKSKPATATPSRPDTANYLTPQPLKPRLSVEGWDGYTGLQAALCMKLANGDFVPVVEAGTVPPASRTQTLSTARQEQESLAVALYAVLPGTLTHATLVMELSAGPIRITGEAIRQVELVCTVDEDGTVWIRAQEENGEEIPCTVMIQGERRIATGR
jgi:hypothetical protein